MPCAIGRAQIDAPSAYSDAMSAAETAATNQDLAPELIAYLAAIKAQPAQDAPRIALFNMITVHGMPHVLSSAQLRSVAAAHGPFSVERVDRGVTLICLDGATGHSLDSVSDPQNQWPFPALIDVYASGVGDSADSALVCAVHYQTSDDAALAARTGRLLALLRSVLVERTGHMPIYESPFHVWMSRSASASPGGEQWRNNLYFYDIADARSSIEWIREIAHEYSHLAFPAIGGDYTDPEAWANGYIGERLLVRWLSDTDDVGPAVVEQEWGAAFTGYSNFEAKLIEPAVNEFVAAGLNRTDLAARDANGMRYVIGLLLWVDQTKGSRAVGDLLWNMNSADPSDLFDSVKALGAPPTPRKAIAPARNSSG
jgi:hypothetical protein